MSKLKIFAALVIMLIALTACNSKVSPNQNQNLNSVAVLNQNSNQPAANANLNSNLNPEQLVAGQTIDFAFDQTSDGMIKKIINKTNNEVWISDPAKLCGAAVMIFAHPANSMKIILTQYNPGSERPVRSLYLMYLQNKTCKKLVVSSELSDFGARVLSPDQTKLAVALETNEAKTLKVLDLIADQSQTVVTLGSGETLNGGYGGLSDKFDIKWLDNSKIQYTVYFDTVKNYAVNAPQTPEKVKEIRTADISQ